LRFAGYAALFGRRDRGGDVIAAGAFAESLRRRLGAGEVLPILWQHDPARPIGMVEHVSEDARGLRVVGRVSSDRVAELVRAGTLDGLFRERVRRSPQAVAYRDYDRIGGDDLLRVRHVLRQPPAARPHLAEPRLHQLDSFDVRAPENLDRLAVEQEVHALFLTVLKVTA